jgi:hypothetical protein
MTKERSQATVANQNGRHCQVKLTTGSRRSCLITLDPPERDGRFDGGHALDARQADVQEPFERFPPRCGDPRKIVPVASHQPAICDFGQLPHADFEDGDHLIDLTVKLHTAPVFNAIRYLMGQPAQATLEAFPGSRGAQSSPSRTKDSDDVDFSTGSVGPGAPFPNFASKQLDYVRGHGWGSGQSGRMEALIGNAELD